MPGDEEKRLAEAYIAKAVTSGDEQIVNDLKAGMPDLNVALDELVAEGEYVVALWRSAGTQTQELWGVAPTGREVGTRHFTRFTIRGGKIEKAETLTDRMSVLAQLGSVGRYAPDFGLAPRKAETPAGARSA